MQPNIANINGDFDDQELPDSSDFDFCIDLDEDEREIEVDCFACGGSGEGHASDTTCTYCRGLGTITKRKI